MKTIELARLLMHHPELVVDEAHNHLTVLWGTQGQCAALASKVKQAGGEAVCRKGKRANDNRWFVSILMSEE